MSGKNKMDRYQKVEKQREGIPINENEIRITAQGRMRSYITYATGLLQEKGSSEIIFKAMGRAINKTVMIVELIKMVHWLDAVEAVMVEVGRGLMEMVQQNMVMEDRTAAVVVMVEAVRVVVEAMVLEDVAEVVMVVDLIICMKQAIMTSLLCLPEAEAIMVVDLIICTKQAIMTSLLCLPAAEI